MNLTNLTFIIIAATITVSITQFINAILTCFLAPVMGLKANHLNLFGLEFINNNGKMTMALLGTSSFVCKRRFIKDQSIFIWPGTGD